MQKTLYLLALLKLVLPFLLQDGSYQPHRDEFLYLEEGKHLDWGYMEVPPLLSLFSWLVNTLGGSLFWIKFFPGLFGALTFLLAGRLVLHMGGRFFALLLVFLPFVFGAYMRLFHLFQPNFLEVFFWTLILYALIRFFQTKRLKYLYYWGAAVGLGLLSKYSVAFITLASLAALLVSSQRWIFTVKTLYTAAALALLIVLPNLVWQYLHAFPVLAHMRELRETQLQFLSPVDFIVSQFMMNLPCVLIWLAAFPFMATDATGVKFRFVGWTYLFVILLLLLLKGKDYYALGVYPVLFAFGALYIEKATRYARTAWRVALVAAPVLLGAYALPLIMPLAPPGKLARYYQKMGMAGTGPFKWEDQHYHPLPQDFADMIGWKEIALMAGRVYNSLPEEEKKQTLVYCRGYFTAGALNYYRREAGLPVAHSDNASFLFWMPEKYQVKNLLLIGHRFPDKDDIVFQQFSSAVVADSLNMPLAREHRIKAILFRGANEQVNGLIEKGIRDMKAAYRR